MMPSAMIITIIIDAGRRFKEGGSPEAEGDGEHEEEYQEVR